MLKVTVQLKNLKIEIMVTSFGLSLTTFFNQPKR